MKTEDFTTLGPGDVVAIRTHGWSKQLLRGTVERVTANQIVVADHRARYRRKDGREVGSTYGRCLALWTPEVQAEWDRDQDVTELEDYCRTLSEKDGHKKFARLPADIRTALLQQLRSAVTAYEAANGALED